MEEKVNRVSGACRTPSRTSTYASWESGRGRETQRAERQFAEIMAKKYPNVMIDVNRNLQEVQATLRKMISEALRQIVIKLSKAYDRERLLRAEGASDWSPPGDPRTIMNSSLVRNFGGQKAVD